MKKISVILLLFLVETVAVIAQSTEDAKDSSIAAMLNYKYLKFEDQQIHSPGINVMFTKGNMNPPLYEDKNSLMIGGMYSQYHIMQPKDEYDYLSHDIGIMAERKIRRHLVFGLLASQAAEPFYGGLHTFQGILGYGYELWRNQNASLTLGGGLAVIDMGLELPNGTPWPVIPVPLLRFHAVNMLIDFSFEFMHMINTSFTFLPENKIRLTGSANISYTSVSSIRDLAFDVTLWYRPFSKDFPAGDFAGIGAGVTNSGFGFVLPDKEKSYDMNYYSAYGVLDLSFMKVSGGYSFSAQETYDGDIKNNIGNGFFISASLGWRF